MEITGLPKRYTKGNQLFNISLLAAAVGNHVPQPIDMTGLQTWTQSNNPAGYGATMLNGFSSSDATGTIIAALQLSSGFTPPTDILYSTDSGASFAITNRPARTTRYAPTIHQSASLGKWFAHS